MLEVRAALTKIGSKSITGLYEMTNLKSGDIAATFERVYVLFDLHGRKAIGIDKALRQQAEVHLVAPGDGA